jgi:hypothetical protein
LALSSEIFLSDVKSDKKSESDQVDSDDSSNDSSSGKDNDERKRTSSAAAELGRLGGKKRAETMSPERRSEIARKAAEKRWRKP